MENSSLFPPIKIPDFQDIQLSKKIIVSSQLLYEYPKALFRRAFKNFLIDESKRKKYISRSPYIKFLKDYCKTNKYPHILKYAKTEWNNLDEQRKELYRSQPTKLKKKGKSKAFKKYRMTRSSFSLFIEIKCKEKSRSYEEFAVKWRKLEDSKKKPFQELSLLDKQRKEFEKIVFSRFELIIRLLGAGSPEKMAKRHTAFSVFKEELKASLMERGFIKIPNLEVIGRKRYSKLDVVSKKRYADLAHGKNEEVFETIFEKVMDKVNVDYGRLSSGDRQIENGFVVVEEDFDGYLGQEGQFSF